MTMFYQDISIFFTTSAYPKTSTNTHKGEHMQTDNSTLASANAAAVTDFNSATGPVAIRMNNDYLFRALLQRNNNALKGLICSLLHMSPEEVLSVNITNPIVLGTAIDAKTFFLDISTLLNNNRIVNLELQVINEYNWPERSLLYLCRSFDNLNHGSDYRQVRPVVQISLLDFTLFRDHPEFYATYQVINTKNHILYSDKLRLSVVDLTKIDMATEEDKLYHIDCWASLFKATTWEEIRMLAQKDEYIRDAAGTIYQVSQEEMIRLQCEAREDYFRRQRDVECHMQELYNTTQEQQDIIQEQQAAIAVLREEIARLKNPS